MRVLSYLSGLLTVISGFSVVVYFYLLLQAGGKGSTDAGMPHWLMPILLIGGGMLGIVGMILFVLRLLGTTGIVAGAFLVVVSVAIIVFHVVSGIFIQPHWDAFVKATKTGNKFDVKEVLKKRDESLDRIGCKGVRWYYDERRNICYTYDLIYNPLLIRKVRN